MFPYLLLVIAVMILYFRHKYSPYFALPTYFIDWDIISTFLRRAGPKNEPVKQYFLQKELEICEKLRTKGMAVLWLIFEPILFVFGPEPYKFFANETNVTDKPPVVYKNLSAFSENGIFRSNGEIMKRQRKLLRPGFFPNMLRQQVTAMNVHARHLVKILHELKDNTAIDIGEICHHRILFLFMDAVFGLNPDTEEKECQLKRFRELTKQAFESVMYVAFRPWLYWKFMLHLFPKGRDILKIEKEVIRFGEKFAQDLIESHISRTQGTNFETTVTHNNGQQKSTFGDVLVEEHLKDPLFPLKDLQTEILTLTIAGTDTTSESLTWSLWLLGLHEEVQEKLYEEIQSLPDEEIQYDDILKLTYLDCLIKESLRLYPTCPFFVRQASKDVYFENYTIPKGTAVVFMSHAFHRNPELYPNPEVFNPERFAENGINSVNPWEHVAFAEGARSCIGKNYALLDLKIFIAYIIRNFKIISLSSRDDVQVIFETTLTSANPISVKFIPR